MLRAETGTGVDMTEVPKSEEPDFIRLFDHVRPRHPIVQSLGLIAAGAIVLAAATAVGAASYDGFVDLVHRLLLWLH